MHRMNELASRLTPQQLQQVEDFAEFLIAQRRTSPTAVKPGPASDRINVDAIVGLLAGMGDDKPDKELIREAWDEVVAKHDR